jgi:hypothetical protein
MKLCGSCLHLNEQPIESGLRYCERFCSWRWPDERQYEGGYPECLDHFPAASLQGRLATLKRALARNATSVCIDSGELKARITPEGWIMDPTFVLPATPKKRKKK